jgi:hypothetical protein
VSPSLRLLVRRLPLMAASLALAVGFWFFAVVHEEAEIGLLVPLVYEGFPTRLVIDGAPLESIYVRLRGPRQAVDNIDPQQVRVRVDLAAARPGNNVVPLAAPMVVVPRGVQVVGISPPAVNLKFIARTRAEEGVSR